MVWGRAPRAGGPSNRKTMLKNRNALPPMEYFVAFESAASQQSFTAAARDLNVSESAISRKIKLLELHFDCPLFVRGHRSIRLTPQGKLLLDRVGPALEKLVDASLEISASSRGNSVTLAATNSVATLWLMPRLQKFSAVNKRINITLVASDSDQECMAENIDLTILRGEGSWPEFRCEFLFGERVFPICSPDYLARNPGLTDLKSLSHHPLIDVSNQHTEWLNWKSWLHAKGMGDLPVKQSIVVNTYPLAVQAAQDGLGIGLGWKNLVDRQLASGQLVKPWTNVAVQTHSGYYLLVPEKRQPFAERKIVQDWLLSL
jgi:LysR family transcriptional regulator, glycine cleavage system transcriptional activator